MSLSQHLLSLLPPEFAHKVGKWAMKHRLGALDPSVMNVNPITLAGAKLRNPLGLAAGFDKNAELVLEATTNYGFGWVEVGSITYLGGRGNPKPRLFRVGKDELVNRMGLNGLPAADIVPRLQAYKDAEGEHSAPLRYPFAINVAKSHHPEIVGDAAIRDIMATYSLVRTYGIYTVINVSCPNTREGKTFEEPGAFSDLLWALRPLALYETSRPVFIKLSPVLVFDYQAFKKLLNLIRHHDFVKGLVFCNTLPLNDHRGMGRGGLSGRAVGEISLALTAMARRETKDWGRRIDIIGCGGVYEGMNVARYFRVGADAVQAYCGFVRGKNAGPRFTERVLLEYLRARETKEWGDLPDVDKPYTYSLGGSYLENLAYRMSKDGAEILANAGEHKGDEKV